MNMTPKDRDKLAMWLRAKASLQSVESTDAIGLVGNERFTESSRRAFKLIWAWSAVRFSGDAGQAQDRYIKKCGQGAFERRVERARELARRLQS